MTPDMFDLNSSLMKGAQAKEREARMHDLKLFRERPVETRISPLYERYTGAQITVAFNGNFRKFPVDGSKFLLTRGHYNSLMKYLHHIDRQIKLAKTNAKFIDQNVEGDFRRANV